MKSKILKGLCVSVLAVLGMVSFSGCSSSIDSAEINNLTQQIENLETQVDNLEAEIEKLKQSNSSSNGANEDLQNELEIIKQEQLIANDILKMQYLKEEAWQKYLTARSNYLTNANGVRSNLVLEVEFDGYTLQTSFYKRPDGKYAMFFKEAENDITLIYQEDAKVYKFSEYEQDGTLVNTREESRLLQFWNIDYSVFSAFPAYSWEVYGICSNPKTLTKDDITNVQIAENGNLKITFTKSVFFDVLQYDISTQEYLYQYNIVTTKELTPDGKMVGEVFNLYIEDYLASVTFNTTFNYGEVDIVEITDYIAKANQTELTNYN